MAERKRVTKADRKKFEDIAVMEKPTNNTSRKCRPKKAAAQKKEKPSLKPRVRNLRNDRKQNNLALLKDVKVEAETRQAIEWPRVSKEIIVVKEEAKSGFSKCGKPSSIKDVKDKESRGWVVPPDLQDKIQSIDLSTTPDAVLKTIAWQNTSFIDIFRATDLFKSTVESHDKFLEENPKYPKYDRHEQKYSKDFYTFMINNFNWRVSSIQAEDQKADPNYSTHKEVWINRNKNIIANLHTTLKIFLRRFQYQKELEKAAEFVNSKLVKTATAQWFKEGVLMSLIQRFHQTMVKAKDQCKLIVIFFMLYPHNYTISFNLANRNEWKEVSKISDLWVEADHTVKDHLKKVDTHTKKSKSSDLKPSMKHKGSKSTTENGSDQQSGHSQKKTPIKVCLTSQLAKESSIRSPSKRRATKSKAALTPNRKSERKQNKGKR